MQSIYADMAARTGGNVYIGVVGPVRTGKSTLIKRIMEVLVLPHMEDPHRRERARDELPQCGSGRTIMTAEPKFVPEEAAQVCPDGSTKLRLRLIDSVGYLVEGAAGDQEEGRPRMVTTPWFDHEIPLAQAAELGTRKVMQEHCSIGLVVTTDGTVTDLPREAYVPAEERAIRDMQATGKPFLVVVNSRQPQAEAARQVQQSLQTAWGIPVWTLDCQALDQSAIDQLLRALLMTFPMESLRVRLPRWVDALEPEHPLKASLYRALRDAAEGVEHLGQARQLLEPLGELEQVQQVTVGEVDLSRGCVQCTIILPENLYYEILSARAGLAIENEGQLLQLLTELSQAKAEYDKVAPALSAVKATGYAVVPPSSREMQLEKPELVKKGGAYGVKLRAAAPSIHMVRVDVDTQICPLVGDEKQSRALIGYLTGEAPEQLWESDIFGKSVYDLIREGLNAKLVQLPEEVREKFRGTLSRIVNEGATGLICLIL